MFSVYQHWDPLKVCIVGRSYPPEFYSWITKPVVRSLFEQIAIETEEDYQNLINKLQSFGVEVLRPDLPTETFVNGQHVPPPMTPRDYTIMLGDQFYESQISNFMKSSYEFIKDPSWPDCNNWDEFNCLPDWIKKECIDVFDFEKCKRFTVNTVKYLITLDPKAIPYTRAWFLIVALTVPGLAKTYILALKTITLIRILSNYTLINNFLIIEIILSTLVATAMPHTVQ